MRSKTARQDPKQAGAEQSRPRSPRGTAFPRHCAPWDNESRFSERNTKVVRARKSIDVSQVPELLRLLEEVQDSGQECVLTRNDEQLAVLTPVKPTGPRRSPKSGLVGEDDPLWDIVGMGASKGPGDISEKKHRYLAEAYADTHE